MTISKQRERRFRVSITMVIAAFLILVFNEFGVDRWTNVWWYILLVTCLIANLFAIIPDRKK